MISIKKLNKKDAQLCFELDEKTISLWSKKQWESEFKKEGTEVFGLSFSKYIIGVCVFQTVLDEAHINFFAISQEFQRQRFGSYFMKYLIKKCEIQKLKKLLLEVSGSNLVAEKFYSNFDFFTVGIRENYYKDGSDALLKEKNLLRK